MYSLIYLFVFFQRFIADEAINLMDQKIQVAPEPVKEIWPNYKAYALAKAKKAKQIKMESTSDLDAIGSQRRAAVLLANINQLGSRLFQSFGLFQFIAKHHLPGVQDATKFIYIPDVGK